jgi:hypothetical protein
MTKGRSITHEQTPRATLVRLGLDYGTGIKLRITRRGVEVWGFYDGCVGIEGGFISWEDFDLYRALARLPLKEAKALETTCTIGVQSKPEACDPHE